MLVDKIHGYRVRVRRGETEATRHVRPKAAHRECRGRDESSSRQITGVRPCQQAVADLLALILQPKRGLADSVNQRGADVDPPRPIGWALGRKEG